MIAIREYQDRDGHSPFSEWHKSLHAEAARKVTTALYRMGLGNLSNVKGVGNGVLEYKINFGPGYRVYLEKMARRSFCFWREEPSSASRPISGTQ